MQTVLLKQITNFGCTRDCDFWTVRADAIIAVHEGEVLNGPLGKITTCIVELISGESILCENNYQVLCETIWPGSTRPYWTEVNYDKETK